MPDDTARGSDEERNPEIEETRTSIDTLLELLKAKGKSELNNVAITLNVDPRIVENWAKVLEKGNLIHITYEVGRMYLEPITLGVEQTADLKTRTDLTKFILEEDLAVERISIDKFAKNIEDLSASIGSIEKLYQQKLPDIQKILAEVDKAYTPIEAKKRSIDHMKDEAAKDYDEINKKADALYAKLGSFSPKQTEANANEKLAQLTKILQSIDDTHKAMAETERTEVRFFKMLEGEIDAQTKELKRQISSSKYNTEQLLRLNSKQLNDLVKSLKEQANAAQQITKEVENFRKEFDHAKHDLDALKSDFTDRYERLKEGMEKDRRLVESQSKLVTDSVQAIKKSLGDVSKFDDDVRRWRKNMNDMAKEVATTRTEILKLTNQLNMLDSNRNTSVEAKAKALEQLSKEGKKTKERTSKIKKSIKDTADEIGKRATGKG